MLQVTLAVLPYKGGGGSGSCTRSKEPRQLQAAEAKAMSETSSAITGGDQQVTSLAPDAL